MQDRSVGLGRAVARSLDGEKRWRKEAPGNALVGTDSDGSAATTTVVRDPANSIESTGQSQISCTLSDGDHVPYLTEKASRRRAKGARNPRLARVIKDISVPLPPDSRLFRLMQLVRLRLSFYDRGEWEKPSYSRVSARERSQSPHEKKSGVGGKRKPDLMDFDIVRGSTFKKSKPIPFWTVFRDVVLFPVMMWSQRRSVSRKLFFSSAFLYFTQIYATFIFFWDLEDDSPVSTTEVMLPLIMFCTVSFAYSRAASTDTVDAESDGEDEHSSDEEVDMTSMNIRSTVRSAVRVRIFDPGHVDGYYKQDMSLGAISSHIAQMIEATANESDFYAMLGIAGAFIVAAIPSCVRLLQHLMASTPVHQWTDGYAMLDWAMRADARQIVILAIGAEWGKPAFVVISSFFSTLFISMLAFFALSTAESVYHRRCLNATYFVALTSASRARRLQIPHFRLHKLKNIKLWFSLRSYLKRKGPQRSVDIIVSTAFAAFVVIFALLYAELVQNNNNLLTILGMETMAFSVILSLYLLRIMTLGAKVSKKYKNPTALLVEQMNLYVRIEANPSKKEELALCQNMLKLAVKVVKELESSKKKSAIVMSPFLYNVTKIVIIGALSAAVSRFIGFTVPLKKLISGSIFV